MTHDRDSSSAPKKVFDFVVGCAQIVGTIVGIIALIISFIALVWVVRNPNGVPQIIDIISGEATATPRIIILPSDTPLPTYTPYPIYTPRPILPTNTPAVSRTPTESPTAATEPTLELPFFDNFDQGLRPEWDVTEGQPIITQGWLTASSGPLALEIGYFSDFTLEFDFKSTWRSAEFAGVKLYFPEGIAVVPDYGRINWQAYESGKWNTIVHSDTFVRAPARIQVTRVGNQHTVYRNGQYITDIVYGSGMQGPIRIVIEWNQFFIDNFSLTSP